MDHLETVISSFHFSEISDGIGFNIIVKKKREREIERYIFVFIMIESLYVTIFIRFAGIKTFMKFPRVRIRDI